MKAPSPFRIVILLERSDDESRCRAGELINHLSRVWFEPELWRWGSDTEVAADCGSVGFADALQPQWNGLVALMRLAWRLWSRRPALVYSLPSRTIDWGTFLPACSELLRCRIFAGAHRAGQIEFAGASIRG